MNKFSFKQTLPYIGAVALFLLLTFVFLSPLIEGKRIETHDNKTFRGGAKEITDYREATGGEEALWTNSMFGGMPAYQILISYKSNFVKQIDRAMQLFLPHPAGTVMLYFIGFFILMLALGASVELSVLGAVAYAFSSYFFIILGAGHNTKAHAIAYMAPVLAGVILAYRGKYLLGAAITALFLSLEIVSNHLQITYYLFMILGVYFIFELVGAIKEKMLPQFAKATGILVVAGVLAILPNISNLWSTYEYSKETIRGRTELTTDATNRTSGLDKDYATQWSYGIGETFSLMIPNVKGGGNNQLGNTPEALEEIADPQMRSFIGQFDQYWGEQPLTSGPVYVGAIIMMLFLFGAMVVKGRMKWFLLTATLLSILLSWGKNFMPLTDLFLDYFPFYNKFRAVSTTLVIAELTIPILAVLGLKVLWDNRSNMQQYVKPLCISFGVTAGISLLFWIMPGVFFNFISQNELPYYEQIREEYGNDIYNEVLLGLESARMYILRADAIRSFVFITLAATTLWMCMKSKLNVKYGIMALAVFIVVDMFTIDRRYLKDSNFTDKRKVEQPFVATSADKQILKDKDPNFRVLNMTVSVFSDASTSYFHKSIGGYHAAKLRRYQELYDHQIAQGNMEILNMLNTKYIIRQLDKDVMALPNPNALGNGWYVSSYEVVDNADAEIEALTDLKPADEAVIDKRFKSLLPAQITRDSTASVALMSYKPNELVYRVNNGGDGLIVFSEIYYDKGWNAYVDGKLTDHFRANYVLRGLSVPAGEHEIVFKFEPKSYFIGEQIALVGSILLVILLILATYFELKNTVKQKDSKK